LDSVSEKVEAVAGSRVGSALAAITRHIRTHALGPGDRLPSEAELSKSLQVSRSVVREAFRALAAFKLIELQPGRRAVVAGLDFAAMAPVIEHGVLTEQISILQVYDVRRTIEIRTAELAALRATEAESAAIRAHAAAMRAQLATPVRVMEEDLAFHLAIAKSSRNPVFALIVGAFESVTRQTWPIGWRSRATDAEQMVMINLHGELADAIAAGEPQRAAAAMARHFDESVRALVAAGLV
jgi:GntR family transcriptional regulator, transcriptional repressor for pyruvate dehydrogenase complex